MENVGDSYDVQFIKQVSIHSRDRLERATKNAQRDDDYAEFMKQVPMHPRDKLAWATKNAQRDDDDDTEFIKQVLMHPRDRLARANKMHREMMMV